MSNPNDGTFGFPYPHPGRPGENAFDEVRAAIERALSRSGTFPSNMETAKEALGAQLIALAAEPTVVEMMDKEYDNAGEENYGPDCMSAALRALARACKL